MTFLKKLLYYVLDSSFYRLFKDKWDFIFFPGEWRVYGISTLIKKQCGYPTFLTLPIHFIHGWVTWDDPIKVDLENTKYCFFVWSKRHKASWDQHSEIPSYISGSAFINYRRERNLRISAAAKGTLVFPGHSVVDNSAQYDRDRFLKCLDNLNESFKPLIICLHFTDFMSAERDFYQKNGYKVVTAGHPSSSFFPKRFYENLSSVKNVCSNDVGSHIAYAIDLGLNVFLIDQPPVYEKSPRNYHALTPTDKELARCKAFELLHESRLSGQVSDSLKCFIDEETGIYDTLTKSELRKVIFTVAKKHLFSIYLNHCKYLISQFKNKVI